MTAGTAKIIGKVQLLLFIERVLLLFVDQVCSWAVELRLLQDAKVLCQAKVFSSL